MSRRYNHLRRRLAMVEASLGIGCKPTETPLWAQVDLEAQQNLSPEDLLLFKSGQAAREEGRFHSLEEHAVSQKFRQLQDAVAQRYGFASYGRVLADCIEKTPNRGPSAETSQEIIRILNWGRDNCAHLEKLREAREALNQIPPHP